MTAPTLIALVSLAVGLFIQLGVGMFKLGQHSQRITALEEKAKDHGVVGTAVAVLTASMGEVKAQLGEISHDVKNLLTGRVTPASRRKDSE